MKIINIIIVRFSLKLSGEWERRAYGQAENRRQWLEKRIFLMRKTLAKSISGQTKPPDRVFILCDEGDKSLMGKKLQLIEKEWEIVFVDRKWIFKSVFDDIRKCNYKNIAISRIDSDDYIAKDYLENINKTIVRSFFDGEKFDYVVACNGYRTDGSRLQKLFYRVSPFITSFETNFSGLNVYSFNHEHVEEKRHIANLDAEWMQYLHGGNISNGFHGKTVSREEFYQMIGLREDKIVAMQPVALTSEFAARFGMVFL